MLDSGITECPHCGDKEIGYYYIVTHRYQYERAWGNDKAINRRQKLDFFDEKGGCRCSNCHKFVTHIVNKEKER